MQTLPNLLVDYYIGSWRVTAVTSLAPCGLVHPSPVFFRTRVGQHRKGSFAAFVACATSTLLLFGWCREEATEEEEVPRSCYYYCHDSNIFRLFVSVNRTTFGSESGCCVSYSSRRSLLLLCVIGGVSGAVGEVLPLGVDDNLSMPIVSGAVFLALHRWSTAHVRDGLV